MNDIENDYGNPCTGVSEAAMKTGRNEAVNAIYEQGMALRDAANVGVATEKTRQAEGALQIWRAAYAAAYGERLAIDDQLAAYIQGAGIPDTISEHHKEIEQRIENYFIMKAECAKASRARQRARVRDDEGWFF